MMIAHLGISVILLTAAPDLARGQQRQSAAELLDQFKSTRIFWQQLDVAKKFVEIRDASLLPQLESWLSHDDRHLRGNAAFIFAALGDPRGLDVITILNDRSVRPEGQGMTTVRWSLPAQIATDRYYAVHLLGELKDPRAVRDLVAVLQDEEVNYKVAWALGGIGGEAAVQGLMEALHDKSPDVRVIAIEALGKFNAKETLPSLGLLLDETRGAISASESRFLIEPWRPLPSWNSALIACIDTRPGPVDGVRRARLHWESLSKCCYRKAISITALHIAIFILA